jgi:hypothetical protein
MATHPSGDPRDAHRTPPFPEKEQPGSVNAHDATGTTQWSGTHGSPVRTDAGAR